jgi:hypothetical protein
MARDLIAPSGGFLPSRLESQVTKSLARIDAGAEVARAADRARIDRVAATAQHAMGATTHLAVMEAGYAQLAPHAADQLRAIETAAVLGIIGVVHRAGQE